MRYTNRCSHLFLVHGEGRGAPGPPIPGSASVKYPLMPEIINNHKILWYHYIMPISRHFQGCKALLVTSHDCHKQRHIAVINYQAVRNWSKVVIPDPNPDVSDRRPELTIMTKGTEVKIMGSKLESRHWNLNLYGAWNYANISLLKGCYSLQTGLW